LNDPQSLHKYLYTHADPVNGIDPSGLFGGVAGLGVGMSMANSIRLAAVTTYKGVYGATIFSIQNYSLAEGLNEIWENATSLSTLIAQVHTLSMEHVREFVLSLGTTVGASGTYTFDFTDRAKVVFKGYIGYKNYFDYSANQFVTGLCGIVDLGYEYRIPTKSKTTLNIPSYNPEYIVVRAYEEIIFPLVTGESQVALNLTGEGVARWQFGSQQNHIYAELGIMGSNSAAASLAKYLNFYIVGRLGYNYSQSFVDGDNNHTTLSGDINIIELTIPFGSINNT
jgi:hypothetical protein